MKKLFVFIASTICIHSASAGLKIGDSLNWNIEGQSPLSSPQTVFDLDLFDTSASFIKEVKAKGKIVICYFSAGSYEAWRPDAKTFPDSIKGKKMDGWDERWLNVKDQKTLNIMYSRMNLAKEKGCDGVEFDNVDAYGNATGFNITKQHSIVFLKNLSAHAMTLKLYTGLKNSPDIVTDVVDYYDFSLVEECARYGECAEYAPFISKGKPVFQVEYGPYKQSVCDKAKKMKFYATFFPTLSVNGKDKPCK